MRPRHAWVDDIDCPESGKKVTFARCLSCDNFQVWHEKDEAESIKRCKYEFEDLKSRGYYDGTWNDHPENFDPETWDRLQPERENNERVRMI